MPVGDPDQGHALRALHLGRLAGARRTAPHHTAARPAEKAGETISRLFFDTLDRLLAGVTRPLTQTAFRGM